MKSLRKISGCILLSLLASPVWVNAEDSNKQLVVWKCDLSTVGDGEKVDLEIRNTGQPIWDQEFHQVIASRGTVTSKILKFSSEFSATKSIEPEEKHSYWWMFEVDGKLHSVRASSDEFMPDYEITVVKEGFGDWAKGMCKLQSVTANEGTHK
jgi:hypothetical protein